MFPNTATTFVYVEGNKLIYDAPEIHLGRVLSISAFLFSVAVAPRHIQDKISLRSKVIQKLYINFVIIKYHIKFLQLVPRKHSECFGAECCDLLGFCASDETGKII